MKSSKTVLRGSLLILSSLAFFQLGRLTSADEPEQKDPFVGVYRIGFFERQAGSPEKYFIVKEGAGYIMYCIDDTRAGRRYNVVNFSKKSEKQIVDAGGVTITVGSMSFDFDGEPTKKYKVLRGADKEGKGAYFLIPKELY